MTSWATDINTKNIVNQFKFYQKSLKFGSHPRSLLQNIHRQKDWLQYAEDRFSYQLKKRFSQHNSLTLKHSGAQWTYLGHCLWGRVEWSILCHVWRTNWCLRKYRGNHLWLKYFSQCFGGLFFFNRRNCYIMLNA